MILAIIAKWFRPVTNMFLSFVTIFYFGTYHKWFPPHFRAATVAEWLWALDPWVEDVWFESKVFSS